MYRRKRQNFLNQSPNQVNESIPLSQISTNSNDRSSTKLISPRTQWRNARLTFVSVPKISPIPETIESPTIQSRSMTNDKSEMDLSLEEFQRQALNEHNSMRKMYRKSPLKLSESLNMYAQVS